MVTALPVLAEAVASIVKHSTKEAFRESCLDTLQASNVTCLVPESVHIYF